MAIKVSGTTVIDDSRNLSAGIGTVSTSFNVGTALTSASVVVGSGVTINSTGINVTGITTVSSRLNVGTGVTISAGIVTATSFVGNLTGTASTASFATTSFGLSGTPNIVVGVSTLGITSTTDLRLSSIADRTTIVSGNTVSLVYNTGGGNVAICTNPSGAITLNVTGIPTDSSFDNRAISFAVIVNQSTTAYACTNIILNGVAFSAAVSAGLQTGISYSGGTVATGNTSAYDVFNFTGINTVGSASTTLNYKIISNVSGNYRRY